MPSLLAPIVLSACLGALVGLIRQWSEQAAHDSGVDLGGVRTYSFWAMLGALGAGLSDAATPALLAVIVALVGTHQIVSIARSPATNRPGGTTFASVLLTVLIGALVAWGHERAAALVAATVMVMLAIKQPLHAWTRKFTADDIRATLQFVAVTGVILPLVPDRNFGPFDAFYPYKTWMLVVLMSGIGFVGYLAMRLLGAGSGILVTSLFGGLASSTATTLAFSRRSKEDPGLSTHYAMAVVIACSAMLARVTVAVSVLNLEFGLKLIAPFALMALPGAVFGVWLWFRTHPGKGDTPAPAITNPLSLKTVVKFALLYSLIGFLVKAFTSLGLQHHGLLPLSFFSGLTDMDAISLSMAGGEASGSVPAHLALQAVLVAAASNSLVKGAFAVTLGSDVLKRQIPVVLGLTAAAGIAACWLF